MFNPPSTVAKENEERYRKDIEGEKRYNFDAWMRYIKCIEQQESVKKSQKAYDELLTIFPLLYGFWSKYAKVEYDNVNRGKSIYERGLKSIPQCVELWTDYCVYLAEKSLSVTEVRSLFERAANAVGGDFNCGKLWGKYLEFELSQENYSNVSQLYTRLFQNPLKDLEKFWDDFEQFVSNRPINELITHPEYIELQSHTKVVEEQKEIVLGLRKRMFEKGVKLRKEIKEFEENITRKFFHVIPLDELEIQNWRKYITFFENKGNFDETVMVYEKCLVCCSLYIEFHKKFAHFYEKNDMIDKAREVLEKARRIYLANRAESFIALADFEESIGNVEQSIQIYEELINLPDERIGRCNVKSLLSYIYCLYRNGQIDKVNQLFTEYRDKVDISGRDYFNVQHAFFAKVVEKNFEKARKLYEYAKLQSPQSKYAILAQIHFEIEYGKVDHVEKLFEEGLKRDDISNINRVEIIQRYYDFALRHLTIKKVREIETMLFGAKTMEIKVTKKRKGKEHTDSPDKKKQKTD